MNPPSALYGAMNKERKPFTYTPGGLDLSEIKSERMAKRLIRNAMNQGVPEQPVSYIQSPPTPSALNVPNFNCLPVQVFPTFPLPTNPKTLLKSRHNQLKEPCEDDSLYSEQTKTNLKPIGSNQCFVNNNENTSKCISSDFDYKSMNQSLPSPENNTASTGYYYPKLEGSENTERSSARNEIGKEIISVVPNDNALNFENLCKKNEEIKSSITYEPTIKLSADILNQPLLTTGCDIEKPLPNLEEVMGTVNYQNEVKAVKSEFKSENNIADQNGDTNVEAAVTVKLPGKKSTAKTETKVEVVKKVLPDGTTEEIKTTTTRTTIDGKTEITTKTETTRFPKEDDLEDEEYVEEEEEEEQDIVESEEQKSVENGKKDAIKNSTSEEMGEKKSIQNICKEEESVVSNVTENVVITASTDQENSEAEEVEEDVEEKEESKEVENEFKTVENVKDEKVESEAEDDDDEEEEEVNNEDEKEAQLQQDDAVIKANESEEETQEEVYTAIDDSAKSKEENEETLNNEVKKEEIIGEDASSNQVNDESTPKESCTSRENEQSEDNNEESEKQTAQSSEENKEEVIIPVHVLKPNSSVTEEENTKINSVIQENEVTSIPLREPSVPLEKVEDVEIKPIGQIISKSHTEIITTSIDKPTTGLSTQTAYNRIENIVTVNRTTKTLDHAYEQIEPLGTPSCKTYFRPTIDALPTSPQPSKPYQPVYPSEPENERRHSLLLDRLSVDRQIPPADLYHSNYQSGNQNYEQNQWTQEPQSEVLTVSNVKPSTITKNQQWYQQTKKEDISYNNTAPPSVNLPSQQWYPQQVQSQPLPPTQIRPEYQAQPQFQPTYVDKTDVFKGTSNNFSSSPQNLYPSYTPKPTSWITNKNNSTQTTPNVNIQPSNFSYPGKEPVESYQKPAQQFTSSYIPPPWEQDSTYVPENQNQNYYSTQTNNKFTSGVVDPPTWTPASTNSKFSKPKPTSYIPPAPNQSFVKPVVLVEPPKLPGRKTYYSEYERRYISVPESTYIPTENKYQAQPDPSPKYYYDNNEPVETVEHEWRKELREFSEKTQSEQTSVKPPWEEDPKFYVPTISTEYTTTPTWSQTLQPNLMRERSFESEFVRSKEMPKTNTLGRGRPQSSYVKNNISAPIPERVRGVSVDRYNPNNYKSPVPSEYPPVQSHTLDPSIGVKTYHNPNVPAYHSRASAEPREQTAAYPQARQWGEARAPPVQSRSFKYLQWITGTED